MKDDLDLAKLVFLLIGLAAWWFAVPQLARMVTGLDGSGSKERNRRRACVVSAVQHLASPAYRSGWREDVVERWRDGSLHARASEPSV